MINVISTFALLVSLQNIVYAQLANKNQHYADYEDIGIFSFKRSHYISNNESMISKEDVKTILDRSIHSGDVISPLGLVRGGVEDSLQLLNFSKSVGQIIVEYDRIHESAFFLLTSHSPTAEDTDIYMAENTTKTFSSTDFSSDFNDPDGNPFAGILITSLPSKGTLSYNGSQLTASEISGLDFEIAEANISKLTYSPLQNEDGSAYSSFTFKVYNGNEYSASDYVLNVNIEGGGLSWLDFSCSALAQS
ncbi:hypothetical protein LVD15_02955 [Fulvivirga maritima]|uniref:hypothetical protein n=1 Tax=Fulvivirga maritima TaxID=2904247 RepID=UPI001F2F87E3|nr:hypothetical protein [Fulvivirga maritima]UII27407.1 hypothetical protein LVD15_02955 [Fulvivirga maritima]